MTEEILSLAGRIAHFENGRWGGVSHTEKYVLVFPIPQSPSYPEVEKKEKKKKKKERGTQFTRLPQVLWELQADRPT